MSILFSDRFAKGFTHLGNVDDTVEHDTGKVANNQIFWEDIQEAFEGQDEAFDGMLFVDNKVLSDLHHINFRKVVTHIWKRKIFEQCGRS